uniref:Ribosomal protein S5 n=1 Tax=Hepatozoon canis TaxID=110120 RepID=A0A3Q8TIT6_9APIC|nr:ribosomal protein S5 [Hepatozoon canis]
MSIYYNNINYLNKIILVLYHKNFIDRNLIINTSCKFILLIRYIYKLVNYFNVFVNINTIKPKIFNYTIIYTNILYINITSKPTKSNVKKKYSVISSIGNKNNWIGIGISKHHDMSQAVNISYKNAYNNIYYINSNLLLCNKFKKTKLLIHSTNKTFRTSPLLYNIFRLIGFPISSKILGVSSNTYNVINIIKKLSI